MVLHRPITGTPKTAIVKRTRTGKWWVSISVEIAEAEGTGRGWPICTEEAALARAQRQLAKAPTGSKQRAKKRKVVARAQERVRNRRKNFIEQEACKLTKRFGLLAVEALVVRNMVKNPKLAILPMVDKIVRVSSEWQAIVRRQGER